MRDLAAIAGRIADLERRVFGMMRHGTVAEVDPAQSRVRLRLGDSTAGGDFLGPWVPYSQIAGALRAHIPPSVGQQMTLVSPSGDMRQAVAVPLTFSDDIPAPSEAGDQNVITYGDVTLTLQSDRLSVAVGGVSFVISADGVTITGGRVEHDGRNIGSSHIHGGVTPGPGTTGIPAN